MEGSDYISLYLFLFFPTQPTKFSRMRININYKVLLCRESATCPKFLYIPLRTQTYVSLLPNPALHTHLSAYRQQVPLQHAAHQHAKHIHALYRKFYRTLGQARSLIYPTSTFNPHYQWEQLPLRSINRFSRDASSSFNSSVVSGARPRVACMTSHFICNSLVCASLA